MSDPRPVAFALLLLFAAPVAAVDDQVVTLQGVTGTVPREWVAQTPASTMRLAEFSIPAADGGAGATMVVYYFGPGQGGSVDANVERWVSQFSNPDGSPVAPAITPLAGALPATLVELRGSYARGVGLGPAGEPLPDQVLLAAVVETPDGNLYPQMHGPAALVLTHKPAFVDFVRLLKPAP